MTSPSTRRMPSLFIGHGSPLNAIEPSPYSRAWAALGRRLPTPRAVLCISAHWYVPGSPVTADDAPRTLHDFRGFPPALYAVNYPAPGDPGLARRVAALATPTPVPLSLDWGLDHGSWSVLVHLYPDARVPVLQLGIDARQPPAFHYALGQRLAPLLDEGVLVLGSGNVVHNLGLIDWREDAPPQPYASEFEATVVAAVRDGRDTALIDYPALGPAARQAVPTPEHYLPLLYVLGTRQAGEAADTPLAGISHGSISMLCVTVGG